MIKNQLQVALSAAFTAVFIGYFAVWLPGPAAGLRFMGLEMGEWIKFMGAGAARDWFYAPPITLGLALAWLTAVWSNARWQTWGMRGMAIAVSLLSFPAIEDITGQFRHEYALRVYLIGLVILAAVISGLLAWKRPLRRMVWVLLALIGLVGAIGPTWYYLEARAAVSAVLGMPLGIGLGVWLNGAGHLGVTAVSLARLKVNY
ncbi:MAG: hypothetical protein GY803_16090 [Chloroflexi bacterium]|nr:hypothetical protein [Chloroflexota bacterium]